MEQKFQESPGMICLLCRGAAVRDDLTSISFARGELRVVISRVPARVCPACSEAYVDADVAAQLLRIAEAVSRSGARDARYEYAPAEL
jgi:YgiT-type zinc finger domain-containing protein